MSIAYSPIGVIHSPFKRIENMPIQPAAAVGVRGTVEVDAEFAGGLRDLDGFSHIILLYHFHRAGQAKLTVTPFLDTESRGLFATRAPSRPNPIGLSVVKLLRVEGSTLHVENVDILDGTPLLDIKPYVPRFDHWDAERTGWLASAGERVRGARADDRFGMKDE
jgi:tRNA-Thr(GGU) m(6)t(6)A37 methyltransferase TsaA